MGYNLDINPGLIRLPETRPVDVGGSFMNAFMQSEDRSRRQSNEDLRTKLMIEDRGIAADDRLRRRGIEDERMGWERSDRGRVEADRDAKMQAGKLYAGGDVPGAQKALASLGNIDGAIALDSAQHQKMVRGLEFMNKTSEIIARASTEEEFGQVLGMAKHMGLDVSEYADPSTSWETRRGKARVMTNYAAKQLEEQIKIAEMQAKLRKAQHGDAPSGYRFEPDGSLKSIKGGPADEGAKPINGEQAARMALVTDTLGQMPNIRDTYLGPIDPKSGDRIPGRAPAAGIVGAVRHYIGLGDVGAAQQEMSKGTEGVLRTLTGAAAQKEEIAREMARYYLSPMNTYDTNARNLQRFEETLRGIAELGARGATADDVIARIRSGQLAGGGAPKQIVQQPGQSRPQIPGVKSPVPQIPQGLAPAQQQAPQSYAPRPQPMQSQAPRPDAMRGLTNEAVADFEKARRAIEGGADPAAIAKMFRDRTGMDINQLMRR